MRSQAAAAALAFRYKSCRAIVRKPAGFRIRPALRCQWEKTSLLPSLRRRIYRPPSAAMAFAPCVLVRSPPLEIEQIGGTMPGQLRVVLSPLRVKCACPSDHATATRLLPPRTTVGKGSSGPAGFGRGRDEGNSSSMRTIVFSFGAVSKLRFGVVLPRFP
jgi:hypothetical protein